MTEPDPVERDAHDRTLQSVLRDHAGNVGVVVLDTERLAPAGPAAFRRARRPALRDPRGGVVGVQVADNAAL